MANLKQSTAYTRTFMMIQSSDHISGLTGATVAVKLSKAGGGGASAGGTVTEVDSTNNPGLYKIALTTTDTGTLGDLAFHCTAASGDPTDFVDQVTANILGDTLPVNVLQWGSTNISGPATAGIPDVNVKNINNVAAATPGASGGVLISGSNTGTTTFGALTCTGSLTISDGLLVSRSTSNTSAITATGNGTGSGIVATSGAGATGDGVQMTSNSTNGNGLNIAGKGTGAGMLLTPGATGNAFKAIGGSTSGSAVLIQGTAGNARGLDIAGQGSAVGMNVAGGATGAGLAVQGGGTSGAGIAVTTTSGDGISSLPTAGHGLTTTGNGTTKHGINATGGATTSDGIRATGGGTGNGINAQSGSGATGDGIVGTANSTNGNGMNLTGVGTGNGLLATGGASAGGDGIQASAGGGVSVLASGGTTTNITGNLSGSVGSVTGAVGSVTGAVGSVTGNVGGNVVGSVASVTAAVAITSNTKKDQALTTFMFLMTNATTGAPMTGLTVTANRSIDGASFSACANSPSEISNGWYKINLAATDLNGNAIALRFSASGANDTDQLLITQP